MSGTAKRDALFEDAKAHPNRKFKSLDQLEAVWWHLRKTDTGALIGQIGTTERVTLKFAWPDMHQRKRYEIETASTYAAYVAARAQADDYYRQQKAA